MYYYMIISNFIERRSIGFDTYIPQNIIQTFRNNDINPFIYYNINNLLEKNPCYNYIFINDNTGLELIKNNFNEDVLAAYMKLNIGAAKADFIRYIALYLYGGLYLDLDAKIDIDLLSFIPKDKDFVFFYDEDMNLLQWCFMIKPRHIIMGKIIEEMINRIQHGENNIFLATGPTVFSDTIFNFMHNTKIYDTNINVSKEYREQVFKTNRVFMNGMILNELDYKDVLFDKMPGYNNEMLYDSENEKYIETYRCETPGLYKP